MKLVAMVLVLFATRLASADPLADLGKAAKCTDPKSLWRPWCIAVDWSKGTVADLPGKNLVGMTIELEVGKDTATALSEKVSFVALAVTKDGKATKVKLTDVKPTSDDERKSAFESIFAATLVFKGKESVAKLPKDMADYVGGLKGSYDATRAKTEWSWTGANPSQARKVGAFWVVIETASSGKGIWATILTDAWAAKTQ